MESLIYSRKISLPDLHYASVGSRAHHQNQVISQCVVEGEGVVNNERITAALVKLAEAVPSCRLLVRGFWGFKRWRATGPLPRVKVLNYEWEGQYQQGLSFLNGPLDLVKGPVAEIIHVISANKTFFVFRVHHAVMDGVGMQHFILSFFRILREEIPEKYDSPLVFENIPEGDTLVARKPLKQAITPLGSPNNSRFCDDSSVHDSSAHDSVWHRLSIPVNDMLLLIKVVLALAEVAREDQQGSVRFNVPIDLRRQLADDVKTSGNFVGNVVLDVAEDESVRSLTKKFNRQLGVARILVAAKRLSRIVRWTPFFIVQWVVTGILKRSVGRSHFTFSGTVSTIGFVELSAFSTDDFRASSYFGIPLAPKLSPMFVVVTSSEKGSEVVLGASQAMASGDRLVRLANKLRLKLNSD
ncbi:MAG: hypothetical protein MI976_22345 [Pseudomonadales bacterium]|nr:hypothetical protein [Pseudomonadales bacterium]